MKRSSIVLPQIESESLDDLISLRRQILKVRRWFEKVLEAIEKKIAELQAIEACVKQLEEQQRLRQEQARSMVRLDARGQIFSVPREHLLLAKDSFFSAMLGSGHWQPGLDDTYFIDVSGAILEHALKLLREPDNETAVSYLSGYEKMLLNEALDLLHLPQIEFSLRDLAACGLAKVSYSDFMGHTRGSVNSVRFSSDNSFVASASDDGTIRLWNRATSACTAVIEVVASEYGVWEACLSADDRTVVAVVWSTLQVWDVTSGSCEAMLRNPGQVFCVAVSSDASIVCSGCGDCLVRVWSPATNEVRVLEGHGGTVYAMCMSSDATFIVTGSADSTLRIWDLSEDTCTAVLEGHQKNKNVIAVCLSSDDSLVVSGSVDKTVKLWDVSSASCVATLSGHTNSVVSVCISTDKRMVVSGSNDFTARIWDVATAACLMSLQHNHFVKSVCLSSDGAFILTGSCRPDAQTDDYSGIVRLWSIAL